MPGARHMRVNGFPDISGLARLILAVALTVFFRASISTQKLQHTEAFATGFVPSCCSSKLVPLLQCKSRLVPAESSALGSGASAKQQRMWTLVAVGMAVGGFVSLGHRLHRACGRPNSSCSCRSCQGGVQEASSAELARPSSVVADEPSGTRRWLSPVRRMARGFQRNGLAYAWAYGLMSNLNACSLWAISWALFVKTRHVSPLVIDANQSVIVAASLSLFNIATLEPKFLVYYGAIYATVGSLLRPIRVALAAILVPYVRRVIDFSQKRLGLPRPIIWITAFLSLTFLSIIFLGCAIFLCCSICRVPVAGIA